MEVNPAYKFVELRLYHTGFGSREFLQCVGLLPHIRERDIGGYSGTDLYREYLSVYQKRIFSEGEKDYCSLRGEGNHRYGHGSKEREGDQNALRYYPIGGGDR